MMNAFEMITLSQGLNLSALFDRRQVVPDFLLLVREISILNKRMSVASSLQTNRFDCLIVLTFDVEFQFVITISSLDKWLHHISRQKWNSKYSLILMADHLILQDFVKRQTRFVSRKAPSEIIANIEAVAKSMGFKSHTRNFKVTNSQHIHLSQIL